MRIFVFLSIFTFTFFKGIVCNMISNLTIDGADEGIEREICMY